jgi:hypothetical protein
VRLGPRAAVPVYGVGGVERVLGRLDGKVAEVDVGRLDLKVADQSRSSLNAGVTAALI